MNLELLGTTEEEIESILKLRRARAAAFSGSIFADVAWDILLQLFAARLGSRRVKLSDLEALAPSSTVARWAAVLEERGFISLETSSSNELWLHLSDSGLTKMVALFRDYRRQQGMI